MDNDVTIAYRAQLYNNLNRYYEKTKRKLNLITDFYSDVNNKIEKKFENLNQSQYLYGIFSTLETFFNDSAIDLLTSYPHKLTKLQNTIEQLTNSVSLTSAIHFCAERKINELSYKRFFEYIKEIYSFFGETIKLDENPIGILIEGKSVRDLYMHNEGKCNFLYFDKAGKFARDLETDKAVELSDSYLYKIKDAALIICDDFFNTCSIKHINDIPSRIFKRMWELSSLNRIVPFEKQWRFSNGFNGETVLINRYEHYWSSAEQALFSFFRQIHSNEGYQTKKLDIRDISYALQRWRGHSDERIIQSWLESPFIL